MRTFLRHFRRSSPNPPRPRRGRGGFTLIELLVVIALMVLITAAILVRQSRFDSSTLLRSLSYSIALSVRSAQVYGTSILGASGSQSNCTANYFNGSCFAPAYGVYFNGASSYLIFADLNNNGQYDPASDVVIQTYQIGGGFVISKFCGVYSNQTMHCSTDSSPITWLTIYFKRPNPDAFFAVSSGESFVGAYIQVAAQNDPTNTHSITVSQTGEIAVGAAGS